MSEPAVLMVHWPGKDTPACADHAHKLEQIAHAMGFVVTATPIDPSEHRCVNCMNRGETHPPERI